MCKWLSLKFITGAEAEDLLFIAGSLGFSIFLKILGYSIFLTFLSWPIFKKILGFHSSYSSSWLTSIHAQIGFKACPGGWIDFVQLDGDWFCPAGWRKSIKYFTPTPKKACHAWIECFVKFWQNHGFKPKYTTVLNCLFTKDQKMKPNVWLFCVFSSKS